MTAVVTTFICISKIGFNMPNTWNIPIAVVVVAISIVLFYIWKAKKAATSSEN